MKVFTDFIEFVSSFDVNVLVSAKLDINRIAPRIDCVVVFGKSVLLVVINEVVDVIMVELIVVCEIIGVVVASLVVVNDIVVFVNFGSNIEVKVKVPCSLELAGTVIGLGVVVCIRFSVLSVELGKTISGLEISKDVIISVNFVVIGTIILDVMIDCKYVSAFVVVIIVASNEIIDVVNIFEVLSNLLVLGFSFI